MRERMKKVGEIGQDNLIAGLRPPTTTTGVTIRKGSEAAVYERGTVMAASSADGKLVVLGTEPEESVQKFSGDGATKVFTVTDKPDVLLRVKVGDVDETGWTYEASTGKLTLASAPATGTENVSAAYSAETLTPAYILCDSVEVGKETDVGTAAYRSGCFNTGALIVAEGYALTLADRDALRKYGIVLCDNMQ